MVAEKEKTKELGAQKEGQENVSVEEEEVSVDETKNEHFRDTKCQEVSVDETVQKHFGDAKCCFKDFHHFLFCFLLLHSHFVFLNEFKRKTNLFF